MGVVLCLGVAAALLAAPARLGIGPRTAWMCSLLSLVFSVVFCVSLSAKDAQARDAQRPSIHLVCHHLALFFGVVAGILLVLLLAMRSVYVGIDLFRGYPWQGNRTFGFTPFGLWAISALCVSSILSFLATRDGRVLTVFFWLLLLLFAWACLLSAPFQPTKTGGFERTDATLILVECLSALVLFFAITVGWMFESGMMLTPCGTNLPSGLRPSLTVICLALNIAVLYHFLVPAGESSSMLRMSGLRAGFAAMGAGAGALVLLRRSWSPHLADSALGLLALGLCGIATSAVPSLRIPLDQRYPMVFNAITIGYTMAAAIYAHFSHVWGTIDFDPQSIRHRLVPHLNRFAFFCGAAALLSAVMMCFWPGIPGIAAMDHSFGRVLAGMAAFLFLLLVVLRNSRLLRRLSFHFLTAAVALSMIAFLGVRALPFVSEIH